ncbi:hypothetical protein [Streptomyces sp. SM11]|nr:hypothetical protein [Streptomyces sp. SM11]
MTTPPDEPISEALDRADAALLARLRIARLRTELLGAPVGPPHGTGG